jgi:hypothetical protein
MAFGASKYNALLKHPGQNIIPALIGGAISLFGASKAASSSKKAASTSAAAQTEAARIAAEEARPSYFDYNDLFGKIDTTVDAEGRLTGLTQGMTPFTQGLFNDYQGIYGNNLGLLEQYFQPNLGAGANQIYNEWQGLLAPTRQTQQANLFSDLQNKGITGIEGYDPRTQANVNPMMQGLFSGWAGQDAQMSADSFNEYLRRLGDLQGKTTSSLEGMLGIGRLPAQTLQDAASIWFKTPNAVGANALLQGGLGAAQTQAQGALASAGYKNDFWQGLGNTVSSFRPTTQAPAPITTG